MTKPVLILCLVFAGGICTWTLCAGKSKSGLARGSAPAAKAQKPLAEIDISKIGRIAPKGRVQDKDYNKRLDVIDDLIANGKESIPYLISKIDDKTLIDHHVMDFWPQITVGDVALLILSSFTSDESWSKHTIPGASWEELFEVKKDADDSFLEYYRTGLNDCPGRLKAKWEKIWATYKDRIVWDARERCFKLA